MEKMIEADHRLNRAEHEVNIKPKYDKLTSDETTTLESPIRW